MLGFRITFIAEVSLFNYLTKLEKSKNYIFFLFLNEFLLRFVDGTFAHIYWNESKQ